MTAGRWSEVEKLYHAALQLEPAQRKEFLLRESADEAVRQEVESLLHHAEAGDRLLEENPIWDNQQAAFLSAGARLGPYEIGPALGAGGMGQVYEALDTRLGRKVAIKVASRRFSGRFEREARAIAALSHPHVCTLYDVGPNYLVMELVQGETLAARLARSKSLTVDETAQWSAEIAHALAAAHALGIVHRDLKPGNIMLTKAGAKVLDFGLAKVAKGEEDGASLTDSQTILGTRPYMAPEQVAGLECDARSDIYSMGLIFCEMLTGKRALDSGSSLRASGAKALALHRVIRKCMASDPEDRWQSARDLATNLEWAAQGASPPAPLYQRPWIVGAVTAVLLAAALFWYLTRPQPRPVEAHFVLGPPDGARIALRMPTKPLISVSPDGENLVVVAQDEDAKRALYLRPLKSDSYQRLEQTDGASLAFWSPDGQFIGFFADGKLKKIAISGGAVQTIADVGQGDGEGATWNRDGIIVFAPPRVQPAAMPVGALYWVKAYGGTVQPATTLDVAAGEVSHSWPQFLPDGRRFLYLSRNKDQSRSRTYVQEIGAGAGRRELLASPLQAVWAMGPNERPHLLYTRDRALFAQPWNPANLQLSGEPVPVASDVRYNPVYGTSGFSVSDNGVLVFRTGLISTGTAPSRQLAWYNRLGQRLEPAGDPGPYSSVALSPDERSVAVDRSTAPNDTTRWDIWILDIASGVFTRLTRGPNFRVPVWSPDSTRIAAISTTANASELVEIPTATATPSVLLSKPSPTDVSSWSPDGRSLLVYARTSAFHFILDSRVARRILDSTASPERFSISPDGRSVAYQADESGRREIFVSSFPSFDHKHQISKEGGSQPLWRKDSRELFYLAANNKVMGGPASRHSKSTVPGPDRRQSIIEPVRRDRRRAAIPHDGKRSRRPGNRDGAVSRQTELVCRIASELRLMGCLSSPRRQADRLRFAGPRRV